MGRQIRQKMITVIIPAYNRPDCLQRALASLGLQTDQRFNAVVVDDNSTEDIESVVKLYQQSGMSLNYVRRKENGGAGAARIEGLNFVTKYIDPKANVAFLDSDDILMPNAVATYNSVIANKKDYDVIASLFLEEHYDAANNMYYTQPAINNVTWIHGKIYSLEFLNKYRLRFPDMPYGEDMAFNALVYTLSKNQYNANVPTHIRTMEKRSLTNQPDGHPKSTLGYIQGATWFAESIKNRGLVGQAKYSILPGMSAKLYYYYDFVTLTHPEFTVREDCIKFFKNIGFAELMREDNFVVRFIEEFPNSMPKFIEKFAYTPQKSFDETMKEFGIDVGNYKSIVRTE
jgi:glycosyltransferase involved in cell wall biosynthesis